MSAAERVGHAAKTIRAAWERSVKVSPQVDAAQALEDAGQLLDPEVAAELATLRKRVAELDKACDEVMGERDHMVDLADKLAYAVAPVEVIGEHSSHNDPWQNALDVITPMADVDTLRSRVSALESERHTTNEALSDAAERMRADRDRIAELESGIAWRDAERDRWADVHALVERAIDKGWTSIDTVDLEVELGPEPTAPSEEPPREGPQRHDYRVCRDLPETGESR